MNENSSTHLRGSLDKLARAWLGSSVVSSFAAPRAHLSCQPFARASLSCILPACLPACLLACLLACLPALRNIWVMRLSKLDCSTQSRRVISTLCVPCSMTSQPPSYLRENHLSSRYRSSRHRPSRVILLCARPPSRLWRLRRPLSPTRRHQSSCPSSMPQRHARRSTHQRLVCDGSCVVPRHRTTTRCCISQCVMATARWPSC